MALKSAAQGCPHLTGSNKDSFSEEATQSELPLPCSHLKCQPGRRRGAAHNPGGGWVVGGAPPQVNRMRTLIIPAPRKKKRKKKTFSPEANGALLFQRLADKLSTDSQLIFHNRKGRNFTEGEGEMGA